MANEYNPYLYRDVERPITNIEAVIQIIKASICVGALILPRAVSYVGYTTGLLFLFIFASLPTYCIHMLIQSQFILCKRHYIPALSYRDIMQFAVENSPSFLRSWSESFSFVVAIFLCLNHFGVCCIYLTFISQNTKSIIDHFYGESSLEKCMLWLLIPLILLNMIPSLKILTPFSMLANVTMCAGIICLIILLCDNLPPLTERDAYAPLEKFPLFMGAVMFCLHTPGVLLAVEHDMKNPKAFVGWCGIFNKTNLLVISLNAVIGILGYIKYGSEINPVVTVELPDTDMGQATRILFTISIFITYGLHSFVATDIVWDSCLATIFLDSGVEVLAEYVTRVTLVLIEYIPAYIIQNVGLLASLNGSFCYIFLVIVCPPIIELNVEWEFLQLTSIKLYKNICIIVIGIVAMALGTYTSIKYINETN